MKGYTWTLGGPLKPPQVESCCDCHWLKKQYRYASKTFLNFIQLFIRPVTNKILQFPNSLHPWIVAFKTSLIGSQCLLVSITDFETHYWPLRPSPGLASQIAYRQYLLSPLRSSTSTLPLAPKSPISRKFSQQWMIQEYHFLDTLGCFLLFSSTKCHEDI